VTDTPLVSTHNLERVFSFGSEQVRAIHDVDLEVSSGQLFVVTGRSGSGKTTLLNLLAGFDRPTSGTVSIEEQDLSKLSEWELTRLRRRKIGFVFQSFALLPLLSTYENVELPLRIAGWGRGERHRRTEECLELVGISSRAGHRPYELSGGEQQRAAIARALVHHPSLILADEPTGELDSTTGAAIFALLKEIVRQGNVAIIVATHDVNSARIATAVKELSDGTFVT
jgi:putative ABC transport system ATP-binding protein